MRNVGKFARFDDALPRFARAVQECLGSAALDEGAFLRDADGKLTFIMRTEYEQESITTLEKRARREIGAYAGVPAVAIPDDLLDPRLSDPEGDLLESVRGCGQLASRYVRLVERRVIGQDWLRGIRAPIPGAPPIVVFASHKGGVGRSTALAVSCAEFASREKTLLVIDLDLEAPGLGSMLVRQSDIPEFGAIDYYVENGLNPLGSNFFNNLKAKSSLVGQKGNVWVVPAAGRRCRCFPENAIGKLARAYLDDSTESGVQTFLDQTRSLIQQLCKTDDFDAVFLDARAGLNESTAAALQGLGADVLLFGVDTPQTWEGYNYFLAHLARFKPKDAQSDWRYAIRMVHAKAQNDPQSLAQFRDHAFELFADQFYDEADPETLAEQVFSFDLDDPEAPHYGWPIFIDPRYYELDPVLRTDLLSRSAYGPAYSEFLSNLADRLSFL